MAAVLTAAASVVSVVVTKATQSPATVSRATAGPSAHLTFSLTSGSRVPWCQVYSGTGSVPRGYSFVIFDTSADPSGQISQPASYSFDGAAEGDTADHWTTEPLQIGTKGVANTDVDIIGVLTTTAEYSYIGSIRAEKNLLWFSHQLPPGPRVILHVITNGHQGMSCH